MNVLIAETDEGRFELKGNELLLRDTVGDPVAIRLRSGNGGIGKVSIDMPDGAGGWTEIGYLFAKRDERAGMTSRVIFEFWKSGTHDGDAGLLLEIRTDEILCHVPLTLLAGGGGAGSGRVTRFFSDDGAYCYNVQGDAGGHLVKYRVLAGRPESEWPAIGNLPL